MERPGSRTQHIKKAQKEALFFQEITTLFHQVALDDKNIQDMMITRVSLSEDNGICTVFFYIPGGEEVFKEKRDFLVLYKPSLRRALARKIAGRYTPDLIFKFDELFEKHQRIENLLNEIKDE